MGIGKGYERVAWEDRFNRPSVAELRAGLPGTHRKLFDSLHRQLGGLEGVSHEPVWHGECWRWTIEYHTRHSDEPLAVLVPSPSNLQIAVPLEPEFTRTLATRRMTRALKEGLDLAADPFDTRWGVWSIQANALVDNVVDLVELKLTHLAQKAG